MSRIRVVFSIGAMHGGGSERQLALLLRHLDREKFEPFLYLVYRDGPLLDLIPKDVPVSAFSERDKGSWLYLPGRMHARRVRDFSRYLKEIRADVSYDRTFLMTLISAAGAQRTGIPNISTIVTNPETGFAPVAGRFQWLKKRMLHRLYNNSTRVLAVSDGARESAIRFYGIRDDKIRTLRNGVDIQLILQQASVPVSNPWWSGPVRTSGKRRVFRMVSAGRLNHEKGFHLLISAVSRLQQDFPEVEFRMAILGDGPHRAMLERQVVDLDLRGQVDLIGFQSNVASWFQSADLFVLPSLMEGMPNVLLEAMACGTAVVSSNCPSGPAEILENGRLGELIDPGSAETLAAGIVRILSKPEEARSRAIEAQAVVNSVWSIQVATRRLEQIFEMAASGRALQGPLKSVKLIRPCSGDPANEFAD
jgi:glycosyltransferase involved in cell wall biosynthesis